MARGVVCAVEVESQRPQLLSRLFIGRAAEEAPRLAGQMFSLCGFSQSTAARLAVARAAGHPLSEDARRQAGAGLLAERVFETIRSLAMQWPGKLAPTIQAVVGQHLRDALKASRAIVAYAGMASMKTKEMSAPAALLKEACHGAGLRGKGEGPAANSLLDAILCDVACDDVFMSRPAENLALEDDDEVASMLSAVESYAARPSLPGRIMETGAYARYRGAISQTRANVLSQRLIARFHDLADALAELEALIAGQDIALGDLMNDGHSEDCGFGTVECARGRLYHSAQIDDEGRLLHYRILAPTEWNFHPAGPFVETLLTARIGSGETARLRVAKLAALFDPCVAFDIEMKEMAHA
nr:nickel-dependent hydrogenase large subunit [Rhizobium sp. L1K21]